MNSYEIFNPVAITQTNFGDFQKLIQRQQGGGILPDQLAQFYAAHHESSGYVRVKGPKRHLSKHDSVVGAGIERIMWSGNRANPTDPEKLAMLTIDLIPTQGANGQKTYTFLPRQWMIGRDVQAVFLYRMSCCTGASAIATYKQDGKLHPALLENDSFTQKEYRDLFNLTAKPQATLGARLRAMMKSAAEINRPSGLAIDHTGEELAHWYAHITGTEHSCNNRPALRAPAQILRMS